MIIFGIIFGGLGAYIIFGNVRTMIQGERIAGTVVDYEARSSTSNSGEGRSTTVFAPVVEFIHNGICLRVPAQTSSGIRGFNMGKSVIIYYDEENPERVLIASHLRIWGFPSFFLVTGLSVIALFP